jgi:hypothetical protein
MKNLANKGDMVQNVYSEPRENKEGEQQQNKENPRQYKKKYHEKKESEDNISDGPELDSDGFEIVGTSKASNAPKKQQRRYYDGPKRHFNKDEEKHFNKNKNRKEEEKTKEQQDVLEGKQEEEVKNVVLEKKPVILVY